MTDLERFAVFMLAASVLFLVVLMGATRGRPKKPNSVLLVILTVIVVVFGMVLRATVTFCFAAMVGSTADFPPR